MALKKIDGAEIEHNMSDKITIINFYADWCGPCKMMAPVFEEIAKQEDITILKINIDNNRDAAQQYGVQGIPSTFIYKNKAEKFQQTGFMPKEILEAKITEIQKA